MNDCLCAHCKPAARGGGTHMNTSTLASLIRHVTCRTQVMQLAEEPGQLERRQSIGAVL